MKNNTGFSHKIYFYCWKMQLKNGWLDVLELVALFLFKTENLRR